MFMYFEKPKKFKIKNLKGTSEVLENIENVCTYVRMVFYFTSFDLQYKTLLV